MLNRKKNSNDLQFIDSRVLRQIIRTVIGRIPRINSFRLYGLFNFFITRIGSQLVPSKPLLLLMLLLKLLLILHKIPLNILLLLVLALLLRVSLLIIGVWVYISTAAAADPRGIPSSWVHNNNRIKYLIIWTELNEKTIGPNKGCIQYVKLWIGKINESKIVDVKNGH